MPIMLFRLRGVPEDEAEEIRELLSRHEIDFYETPAGNWGISMPAMWLKNEDQLQQAKELLDGYQQERLLRAQDAYRQWKQAGNRRSLADFIRESPVQFIVYLAILALLIYVSTMPFVNFLR